MILYIDETENDYYFVVAGLLAKNENDVIESYKSFKKRANNCNLNIKSKQIVFTEFKSILLDKSYQRIKRIMLEELSTGDFLVPYCVYKKPNKRMNQKEKECVYIQLLLNIANAIESDLTIYFDRFGKKDFEDAIVEKMIALDKVLSVIPVDSLDTPGVQFADNLCGVVRLSVLDCKNDFAEIIVDKLMEC